MTSTSDPVRTCVGCRARAAQSELVRLVVVGELIVVDPQRRQPGRGAYVHPGESCAATAVKKRALARALRTAAQPADDLLARVAACAKSTDSG